MLVRMHVFMYLCFLSPGLRWGVAPLALYVLYRLSQLAQGRQGFTTNTSLNPSPQQSKTEHMYIHMCLYTV